MELRKTKDGRPDERFMQRELHAAELAAYIETTPRSVQECMRKLKLSRRAIYWLFDALNDRGQTVARVGARSRGKWVLLGRRA